jgi:TatD DNase family protein
VSLIPLVDTHAHLDLEFFGEEVEAVLQRARDGGVKTVVCVGTDAASSARALALARAHPDVVATAGVHPHDSRGLLDEEAYASFERLAADRGFVAIGEIGLDYFKNVAPADVQREAFARQVALARRLRRPLVLHCREAMEDLLAIVDREGRGEIGGVFHCFSYGPAEAKAALDRGFSVSFSGTLTYPASHEIRRAAKIVPRDRVLVETDSPFLSPQPVRGKRNEPLFVRHTLERLAKERDERLEDLAAAILANAARLFCAPA